MWVYLIGGKPLKFRGLPVTAARFALTDQGSTLYCVSVSLHVLSVHQFMLPAPPQHWPWQGNPSPGVIWHKTSAHHLFLSATTCAKYLSFAPADPLSTPLHPVCCPERRSELITSKDCYVLCLPVGFGQWEAMRWQEEGRKMHWGYLSVWFLPVRLPQACLYQQKFTAPLKEPFLCDFHLSSFANLALHTHLWA